MNPLALVQKVEFADAATYPFADVIFNLYKGGFLNAVSVGFMPLEMQPYVDLEGNMSGYEFTSQELLELSAVPVPANPEALARCVQKGFAEADLARVFSPAPSSEAVYKELISIHQEIASVAVGLAARVVRETHALLKASGVRAESGGDLTLEDLLAAVRQAGANAQETHVETDITTLDQLGEALRIGDEQFEQALGIGGEADGLETSWNGSRKWRDPGRL